MAMVDRHADRGVRVPGVYEKLLRAQCISESQPDPRLFGLDDDGYGQRQRAERQAERDAAELFRERLDAAEAITVPRWMIGGHSVPVPRDIPLFTDRAASSYRVHPDDRIEVVERHEPD